MHGSVADGGRQTPAPGTDAHPLARAQPCPSINWLTEKVAPWGSTSTALRNPGVSCGASSDPGTLAAVLWHGHGQRAAECSGALKLEGSRGAVKRLFALFPAPAVP